ncbi:MAG: DUF4142 domain-containing protein [Bacteroidota bacterium]
MEKEKGILTRAAVFSAFLTMLILAIFTVAFMSCGSKEKPSKDSEAIAHEMNEQNHIAQKEIDAKFLVNATVVNLKEIELGQLAQSNYALIEVSNLGKMMEKEHSEVLKELESLAAKKNITIPKSLTGTSTDDYQKLKNLVGAEFDKAYCDLMVNGHQNAIDDFTNAATHSSDSEIKAWAESKLPSLKNHLEHSLTCQAKAGLANDTHTKATGTQAK